MERARDGDQDAFAELVRAHQSIAMRVAVVTCGSHTDAAWPVVAPVADGHVADGPALTGTSGTDVASAFVVLSGVSIRRLPWLD